MTVPPWIISVLDRKLPHLTGGERDDIAQSLAEAIPVKPIVKAIADSAKAVLATRNIKDGAGDISREIGNNAAQTALFGLLES